MIGLLLHIMHTFEFHNENDRLIYYFWKMLLLLNELFDSN